MRLLSARLAPPYLTTIVLRGCVFGFFIILKPPKARGTKTRFLFVLVLGLVIKVKVIIAVGEAVGCR